jgi:hypothetical protein
MRILNGKDYKSSCAPSAKLFDSGSGVHPGHPQKREGFFAAVWMFHRRRHLSVAPNSRLRTIFVAGYGTIQAFYLQRGKGGRPTRGCIALPATVATQYLVKWARREQRSPSSAVNGFTARSFLPCDCSFRRFSLFGTVCGLARPVGVAPAAGSRLPSPTAPRTRPRGRSSWRSSRPCPPGRSEGSVEGAGGGTTRPASRGWRFRNRFPFF